MDFTNVLVIFIFIIGVILISVKLNKYTYDVQSIAIIILIIVAFAFDRLMLHFYRDFFINQWYYDSFDSIKRGYTESIIVPFIFIGAITYWLTQKIEQLIHSKKKKTNN